jgi:Domain of unknown function (DUF4091)
MSGRNASLAARAALGLVLAGLLAGVFAGEAAKPRRAAAGNEWTVWTASAMERVGKSDPPLSRTDVKIRAARGEYEAFQIVVAAGAIPVTGVDVEASDLTGPEGSTIPRESIVFYREHYVEVTSPSPDPGWGNRPLGKGWYPDALIPFAGSRNGRRDGEFKAAPLFKGVFKGVFKGAPFDVGPNLNQPVWVDVHVPFDAHPGMYAGTLRVSAGRLQSDVPVSLRVRAFTLPLKPTLRSSFGMHMPNLTDRRIHEVLLEHRVMPESVNPGDARELEERFGLNATWLRFWGNFNKKKCTMDPAPSAAEIASALKLYPADLPVHIYSADEIDPCPSVFNTVRSWSAAMHAADPRIRNLVTVSPVGPLYDDGRGAGRSAVDIWPLLPKLWEANPTGIEDLHAKGEEIWSYTALVQDAYSPKWEIDFAPINYRIQPGFLSQSLGLTGILYWRVDLWTGAPFEDLRGYEIDGHFYPGEGMLVYPGGPAGTDSVIPSMRLKWIRKGVEDFEYVAILKRLGRGEWALERARRAGANWHQWTRDAEVVEAVRNELGDEIERLSPRDAVCGARTFACRVPTPGTQGHPSASAR